MKKRKNNKNRGRKSLKAASAIIAAGLTPGIIGAAPVEPQQPGPDVELTAADVVLIDGEEINLDNMFAQVNNDEESLRVRREQMRSDSIRRLEEQRQKVVYGPPPSLVYGPPPPRNLDANMSPELAKLVALIYQGQHGDVYEIIKDGLIDYCSFLLDAEKKGIVITEDSRLEDDLKLNDIEKMNLLYQVKSRYDLALSPKELLETSTIGGLADAILNNLTRKFR